MILSQDPDEKIRFLTKSVTRKRGIIMKKSLRKFCVSVICLSMMCNTIPMMTFAEKKEDIWSWDVQQVGKAAQYIMEIEDEESDEPEVFYAEPDNNLETDQSEDIVASGICGETVEWKLLNDGTLTISGSGQMFSFDQGTPWYDYREQILAVVIEDGVTSIGAYAFAECVNLLDVQIPDTVDTIQIMAFLKCESLESIYIPATVDNIDFGVFPMCKSLKTIDVEEGNPLVCSVDGVMYSADMACLVSWPVGRSENVVVADGVKYILPLAFSGCEMSQAILPEGLECIATQAFLYCENLKRICIPFSVTTIEPAVFGECHSLEAIDVEEGNMFFSSNEGVLYYTSEDGIICLVAWPAGNSNSVDIPENVDQIGDYSFCCCKMAEIVIPENVSVIGQENVFFLCPNLTSVEFTGDAPTIYNKAFSTVTATCYYPANNETWTEDKLQDYGGTLTWIAKGDEVEEIAGGEVTEGLIWSLKSDGVLTISGENAIPNYGKGGQPWAQYRDQISSIVIEEGVTGIGLCAFQFCNALEKIIIPSTVESINAPSIVDQCISLKEFQVSENNPYYCSVDGVLYDHDKTALLRWPVGNSTEISILDGVQEIGGKAFKDCIMDEIILPDTVKKINYAAFLDCVNLKNIKLSNSLEELSHAFVGCTSLESIWIPASVKNISGYDFGECTSLMKINVSEENENYCSVNGVLYNADQTMLVKWPAGNSNQITVSDNVFEIGGGAFSDGTMTDITIPNSITAIGGIAFENCDNLKTVEFLGDAPEIDDSTFRNVTTTCYYPADNTTWTDEVRQDYGGTVTWVAKEAEEQEIASGTAGDLTWVLKESGTLTISGEGEMPDYSFGTMPWNNYSEQILKVIIEDGVTAIGDYAFRGLTEMTSVTIPEGVTRIGGYAFKGCSSLNNVVLPQTLKKLGESAFYACSDLTSIDIPEGIYTIWAYTFKNCTSLSKVTLPSTLIKIDEAAFYGCTSLENMNIPDDVSIIGIYCFKNCTGLKDVHLPAKLTEIREAAFYHSAVGELVIPDGVTSIGSYAFKNSTSLQDVTLPANLETIGESAFYGCTALTNLVIPEKTTVIKGYAFKNCTGLTKVILPESLTEIGESAFYGCNGLTEIIIPGNVKSLGAYGFCRCTGLARVEFKGDAPSIGENAFSRVTAEVYYPEGNTTWTSDVMKNYGGTLTWMKEA